MPDRRWRASQGSSRGQRNSTGYEEKNDGTFLMNEAWGHF